MRQHVKTHRNDKTIVAEMLAELQDDIRSIFNDRDDLKVESPRIDLTERDSGQPGLEDLANAAMEGEEEELIDEENEEIEVDPYENPQPGPSHEYRNGSGAYYVEPADPPSDSEEPKLRIATEESDED